MLTFTPAGNDTGGIFLLWDAPMHNNMKETGSFVVLMYLIDTSRTVLGVTIYTSLISSVSSSIHNKGLLAWCFHMQHGSYRLRSIAFDLWCRVLFWCCVNSRTLTFTLDFILGHFLKNVLLIVRSAANLLLNRRGWSTSSVWCCL
jgi:hypothetical protein